MRSIAPRTRRGSASPVAITRTRPRSSWRALIATGRQSPSTRRRRAGSRPRAPPPSGDSGVKPSRKRMLWASENGPRGVKMKRSVGMVLLRSTTVPAAGRAENTRSCGGGRYSGRTDERETAPAQRRAGARSTLVLLLAGLRRALVTTREVVQQYVWLSSTLRFICIAGRLHRRDEGLGEGRQEVGRARIAAPARRCAGAVSRSSATRCSFPPPHERVFSARPAAGTVVDRRISHADRTFHLHPARTFSLAQSIRFLEGFSPLSPGGGGGARDILRVAFCVEGDWRPVAISARQDDRGRVRVTATGDADPRRVRSAVERMLSLDVDASPLPAAVAADGVACGLVEELDGLRPVCFRPRTRPRRGR